MQAQTVILDRTGSGLTWNWADEFQRQWHPLLGALVRDYPGQVMIIQVTDDLCTASEIH